MTIYNHSLAGTHANTLTSFHIDDFPSAKSLHFHLLTLLQALQNNSKHLRSETVGGFLVQSVLLHQYLGNLLYSKLSHGANVLLSVCPSTFD